MCGDVVPVDGLNVVMYVKHDLVDFSQGIGGDVSQENIRVFFVVELDFDCSPVLDVLLSNVIVLCPFLVFCVVHAVEFKDIWPNCVYGDFWELGVLPEIPVVGVYVAHIQ